MNEPQIVTYLFRGKRKPKPEATSFRKGERVCCHPGLYERPGYVIGPGEFPGQYRVRIIGLGTMDVSYLFLRRPEDMTALEREWIDKIERANGP